MKQLKLALLFFCVVSLAGVLGGCGSSSPGGSSSSPAWNITVSTSGSFAPGGTGTYMISVSNSGSAATSGTATLSDSLPSVFNATSMSGTGWTCTLGTVSCTNPNPLPAGASYPTITLSVSVAQNASCTVSNQATVSGGGAQNFSKSVQTQIGGTTCKIQHVVVIFQENRTPDNLFHDQVLIKRGADIATYGYRGGTKVTLTPISLGTGFDLGHGHPSFLDDCDWDGISQCKMDAFDSRGYQYVQASDVQPYFTMAETYAFGDRMFQTNQGPSFPAHHYIISGTSAVCVPGSPSCPVCVSGVCPGPGNSTTSTFYVADNAAGTGSAGCLAPPGVVLNVIDTSQPFPNNALPQIETALPPGDPLAECFEHPTLTDLLDNAGLSWKYFAPSAGKIWTSPDAIKHMCQPVSADGKYDDTVCSGPDWTNPNPNVVIEGSGAQVITDIKNCQLASVTWVIPAGQNSDHAGGNQVGGPSWVASIVNQIGTNLACQGTGETYWNDTAIIVTWDDWGGWYDHVSPPIRNSGSDQNSYEYGFRVPLIVISPYAKPAYVSHQVNDFGSILKFIEETFALPTVGSLAGVTYADSYAQGDLQDCFDYSQTPLKFTVIKAPLGADHFLNDKSPPEPPDND